MQELAGFVLINSPLPSVFFFLTGSTWWSSHRQGMSRRDVKGAHSWWWGYRLPSPSPISWRNRPGEQFDFFDNTWLQLFIRGRASESAPFFSALTQLKTRLQAAGQQWDELTKPSGTRQSPASSCRDLMHIQSDKKLQDGEFIKKISRRNWNLNGWLWDLSE